MIKGGFYIKARCIQDSKISYAPPHVREIWDWLIKEANHEDTKVCLRGQCIRTYKNIIDGLSWMVGWRKMSYTKAQCENAMKYLTRNAMIATKKTTRGLIITVLNYDKYQDVNNYKQTTSATMKATRVPQSSHTINNNDNNKRINNIYISYKEKICKDSKLTSKAKDKINTRLKEFKEEELLKAIDKFSKNKWRMENNADNGISWFFNSEERIATFLLLKEDLQPKVKDFNSLLKQ